jgi:hypothetical protein
MKNPDRYASTTKANNERDNSIDNELSERIMQKVGGQLAH